MNRRTASTTCIALAVLMCGGCIVKQFSTPTVVKPPGPTRVPILEDSDRLCVQAVIDGHSFRCEIDTGFGGNASVSDRLVKQLGLRILPAIVHHSDPYGAAARSSRAVTIKSLRLGDVEFRDFQASVFPAEHFAEGVDAMLGFALFASTQWTIDGPGGVIAFDKQVSNDAVTVPCLTTDGKPVVEATIEAATIERVAFPIALDTGCPAPLFLPTQMKTLKFEPVLLTNVPLRTAAQRVRVEMMLANVTVRIAEGVGVKDPFFGFMGDHALCGWPLLRHYEMTFDPARKVVAFKRERRPQTAPTTSPATATAPAPLAEQFGVQPSGCLFRVQPSGCPPPIRELPKRTS